ncbi:MAG: hypothetical protein K2O34_12900 [Acetatifactor sp.]|nr:hypothetical protein [Acetatifactor sp.]
MYLYHYFDKTIGPFNNLSDLSLDEAETVLEQVRRSHPGSQCAQRDNQYVEHRRNCEGILHSEFAKKGGLMFRTVPHYMVVEHSPWLSTWYENSDYIKIPIQEFDTRTLSFTYGDSMPTFSPRINDGKEYRHRLYTYPEILEIIDKYGLPQDWNDDGKYGPERYIEVHVWSDETICKYKTKYKTGRHLLKIKS